MSKAREVRLTELDEKDLIEEALRDYALEKCGNEPFPDKCKVVDGQLIVLRNDYGIVLAVYKIDKDKDWLYRPSQYDVEYLVGWNDAKDCLSMAASNE